MFGRTDDQQTTNDNQSGFPAPTTTDQPPAAVPAAPAVTPWQHPGLPTDTTATTDAADPALPEPTSTPALGTMSVAHDGSDANELLDIKQQALGQLSPLVGHLDQTPEEKFRTTMMMIQASDDQSLVRSAYESAQAITDEKARAQALLDIINEINYFTQHKDS
jgi:hypothetical protein